VLQAVADSTRDPVVRVQHLVRAGAFEHAVRGVGEIADEVGEVAERHRRARTDRDVQHPEPGFDVDDRRLLGVLGARQHVDADARARQRGAERADVDVHPATVAGARLCERRGVHAQHGDPLHSAADPTGAARE